VIRDLKIFVQSFDALVFHCRDASCFEADAIEEGKALVCAAFQMKLANFGITKAAKNLSWLPSKVCDSMLGMPRQLATTTADSALHLKSSDVSLLSIGTLVRPGETL
jgi:hypothetical protein